MLNSRTLNSNNQMEIGGETMTHLCHKCLRQGNLFLHHFKVPRDDCCKVKKITKKKVY